jgi:hypothetical protein
MVTTNAISRRRRTSHLKHPKIQNRQGCAINHAVRLIHAVCGLAGSPTLIDEIRAELRADKVSAAMRNRDTGPVFDWLMAALSYQGISDHQPTADAKSGPEETSAPSRDRCHWLA